jgi:hypothetical protein
MYTMEYYSEIKWDPFSCDNISRTGDHCKWNKIDGCR